MAIRCPHIDNSSLSPPTPSQYVYKDECTRCFDNQVSIFFKDFIF